MAKRKLIVANWKAYLEDPKEAKRFTTALRRRARLIQGADAWIAPPATLLPQVAASLKGSSFKAGGQAVSAYDDGKRTGEVTAGMLKAAGAQFTLVGHSERRAAGDTDEIVRQQFARATGAGLTAILCIGEIERSAEGAHFGIIEDQITSALRGAESLAARLVVAYEPVWAIGKSSADAMGSAEVREMVIFIRKTLARVLERAAAMKTPVLYGGSVEPDNAAALVRDGDISGFLVGHASVQIDSFIEIVKAARAK